MSGRPMFPELVADATDSGSPWEALALAIRITRWRLIANLQLDPDPREEIPAEVWHARERALNGRSVLAA